MKKGTVSDIDHNIYKTIKIGEQWWMAENLRTTLFNDGSIIPNIIENSEWIIQTNGAYCWYNNEISNKAGLGALYNWYVVDAASNGGKNVCPIGWHVSTFGEWTTLIYYLTNSGYGFQGSDMIAKSLAATSGFPESGIPGFIGNDQARNNSSGFMVLPGGQRAYNGSFLGIGEGAYFWSSTENTSTFPLSGWCWSLHWSSRWVSRGGEYKSAGFSVRCLMD